MSSGGSPCVPYGLLINSAALVVFSTFNKIIVSLVNLVLGSEDVVLNIDLEVLNHALPAALKSNDEISFSVLTASDTGFTSF